ncbi:MAG: glycosyltransferase [Bryobacteraceae bacterium]
MNSPFCEDRAGLCYNCPLLFRMAGKKVLMEAEAISEIALGVVCPMANEGESGTRFVGAVLDRCQGFRWVKFFAILDTVSTDNTLARLRDLAKADPRLCVVWAPENRCIADAYVRGYREALSAGSDWILEIDAGFSHQPGEIGRFFEAKRRGYDCVFGSRFMKGGSMRETSWMRYVVSRGGTLLTNFLIGTKMRDMTSGFELFSRAALEMVLRRGIQSRAHFFQTEIKVYCRDLRIVEVPICYRNPSSRVGSSALMDSFRQLWRLYLLRRTGAL